MVNKTLNVIKRNFQTYFNSKLSSMVIIFGPLMLILIIGTLLQSTSLQNIKTGIFFSEDDEFQDTFQSKLNERSFIIQKEDSLENCREGVVDGTYDVCIHLKKNSTQMMDSGVLLTEDSRNQEYSGYDVYDIDVYVDFSKQRIVWGIISSIRGVVEEEAYAARMRLIKEIQSGIEEVDSNLIKVQNGLDMALSRVRGLKQNSYYTTKEIAEVNQKIASIESILIGIKSQGILPEPYASQLNQVLNDISSIKGKMDYIASNSDVTGSLGDMENMLISARDSLAKLDDDLDVIQRTDADRLADPIIMKYYSASDDSGGSIDDKLQLLGYIFPSFLIFFLSFGSLLLATIMVIQERKSNAYLRNMTSVNNGLVFIVGNLLTVLIVVLFQITLIVSIASFFLSLNVLLNLYSLIGIVILSALIFSLIGMAMGYMFSSYESAIIASTSLALLFFIFSSSIVPAEMLPPLFSEIVKLLPLTLLETKTKIVLIFGQSLQFNIKEILAISSTLFISLLAVLVFYKSSKSKEI